MGRKNPGLEPVTAGREHPDWVIELAHFSRCGREPAPDIRNRIQLVFVSEGAGIAMSGDRRRVFVAPAVACVNEKEGLQIADGRGVVLKTILFHPRVLNNELDFANIRGDGACLSTAAFQDRFWLTPFIHRDPRKGPEFQGFLEIGPMSARRIERLFDAVRTQLDRQPDNWPCRGRSFLIELLFLLQEIDSAARSAEGIDPPETAPGMDQVILFLYTNYQKKITIRELAAEFNTNRTTLMKSFRDATGRTIKSYLIDIRIKFAASLIRDTMMSLTEIMDRVGFGDLTHFSRTFKSVTGYSPSEYRRKFCWMMSMYPDFRD
jgi:AraC-like DNA-binding protein